MVEDSKKRARGQRAGGSTPAGKGRISHTAAVAAADQDAFAAFTTKYRDMLRFADADEAEAVYSMVSLTQAAHKQGDWQAAAAAHIKGPIIAVPECRAVKRRPVQLAVPASSACSEGGSSDSSAKSAPGLPQHVHQQHWQHSLQAHEQGPCMLSALGPASVRQAGAAAAAQQQAQAGQGGMSGGAGGDIHPGALGSVGGMHMHMGMSMPMASPFFPPGMMMGGAPGCPAAHCMPFLPPWGMNPAMMQSMMFGGLPLPPLPMPPPGMMPFMPVMQPLPGMIGPGPAAAEPAAGIPVDGPLPPAGNAFKAAACGSASKGASSAAACAPALGGSNAAAPGAPQASQAAPSTPAGAAGIATQLRPVSQPQHPAAAARRAADAATGPGVAAEGVSVSSVLCELEQLDVVAVRPWVVDHFCEDVYLLLLDVWRPDSPKVRDAIWAWKLHVKGPRPQGTQPDYRAFLVSLFGLDRLKQLAAAAQAARQGSTTLTKVASSPSAAVAAAMSPAAQPPAAAAAAAATPAGVADAEGCAPVVDGAACGGGYEAAVTTSNLSSEPGAALTAPGPHVMNILVPASKAGGGASATSPHRERLELQHQQLQPLS